MLLEAFYQDNKDKLTAVLTRYSRDYEASRDAVQTAFLKALGQRDIFAGMNEKTCWSWLYTAAKNALTDEKRKTARYDLRDGVDESGTDGGFDTDKVDRIVLRELLQTLPPVLMRAVSLRYWGGLNATEIGRLEGIPPATVRSRLSAAMRLFRAKL